LTAADCEKQATSQKELDTANPGDRQKVKDVRAEFKYDIPGTLHCSARTGRLLI
jgi:hypothetical protein